MGRCRHSCFPAPRRLLSDAAAMPTSAGAGATSPPPTPTSAGAGATSPPPFSRRRRRHKPLLLCGG